MSENAALRGKLVDAGELANWIYEFHSTTIYLWAISSLHNAPETKAEPIVEAEWLWDEEHECFYCSKCDSSALNNHKNISVQSKRCPECGAHMKEWRNKND